MTNIREKENVVQPLLVTSFAIKQAAECVRCILKIDDIVRNIRFFEFIFCMGFFEFMNSISTLFFKIFIF